MLGVMIRLCRLCTHGLIATRNFVPRLCRIPPFPPGPVALMPSYYHCTHMGCVRGAEAEGTIVRSNYGVHRSRRQHGGRASRSTHESGDHRGHVQQRGANVGLARSAEASLSELLRNMWFAEC